MLYRQGFGYSSIARLLESRGYPSPGGRTGHGHVGAYGWNAVAVRRILCSRVYTGDTLQGISERISFKSKKTRRLPADRWVLTENTHEGIIGREEFEEVQRIREGRKSFSGPHKGKIHPFKGTLYCGGCGKPMFAKIRKGRPTGYICSSYAKNGKASCASHHVSENYLMGIIKEELICMLKDEKIVEKVEELFCRELCRDQNDLKKIDRLEKELLIKLRQQEILYMDRLEEKIGDHLFAKVNSGIESRIVQLKSDIEQLKKSKDHRLEFRTVIKNLIEDENAFPCEMVKAFVDRITVYEAGDKVEELLGNIQSCDREFAEENGAIVVDFKINKV